MNPVDSDLEEGEILDDSPSSPYINTKHRELPRRYVVHEKSTSVHKHKRDCKYSIHYHTKKIAKLKRSPKSKDYRKKHHKSTCPHEKSRRTSNKSSTNVEKSFSKNSHSLPNYSLIAEIKESAKCNSLKKQSTKCVFNSKKISETSRSKSDSFKLETDRENVNIQSGKDLAQCNELLVKNVDELPELIDINSDSDIKIVCNSTSSSSSKEESEDEEELRRIALATCAKRKILIESSENLDKNVDSTVVSPSESIDINNVNNVQMPPHEMNSPASDNYEVVDMEVDEDIQASIEFLDNSGKDQSSEFLENLFVIDTKPSGKFKENIQENSLQKIKTLHSNSDDDFEIDILRAELIQSLYRKKGFRDECIIEEEKLDVMPLVPPTLKEKQVPALPQKKHIVNYKKSNLNIYHKQLQHDKQILRKTIINKVDNLHLGKTMVNKTNNLQCNSNNPPSSIQVKKPSERLVIALNEESSSEDSESENPVASIEALISDCRHKSDSEKIQESITNVPKAVSCLSKAQQEEYSSLMKILAKKEKVQGSADKFQPKNGSVQSSLRLLERKLIGFKETLKEKKEFMAYLSKEINSKKSLYMKSKLAAQHLRGQYIAAEKLRKTNLCAWSKSCSDFKSIKKTVSNLESKIIQLQNLSFKLGVTIKGQTCNLPSLSTGKR